MRQQLLSFILALVATATIITQAHGEGFWIRSSSAPVIAFLTLIRGGDNIIS